MTKKLEQRYNNSFELLAALNNFLLNEACVHYYSESARKLTITPKKYHLGSYKELVTQVVKADRDKSFVDEIHRIESELIKNNAPNIQMNDSIMNDSQTKRILSNKETSIMKRATQYLRIRLGRNYTHVLFSCFCSFALSICLMFIFLFID